ncbi:HNH endonuclease [Microbacterium oleivorans]|uniref:HNH endonuclease n=1 Tax=Microbacterium oleivorans TaxID=273677 RepID=A0A4V3B3A4_9MICO|nr:HNH endonuclease [Microbacterium oleivorans]TDL43860.1 HNH endonuclease [Microbacterium oleivorans]
MTRRKPADPMAAARPIVTGRSGGMCERCGARRATDMHHRQLRRHGDHAPANLVHLCRGCHNHVHAKPADAVDEGFIVPSWDDPRQVPVNHSVWGRVRLDDAGGWALAA